jgi:hypothetical protein
MKNYTGWIFFGHYRQHYINGVPTGLTYRDDIPFPYEQDELIAQGRAYELSTKRKRWNSNPVYKEMMNE